MKLTLKIAVGVFLGVLAALCAIEAPSWIATVRANYLHKRAEAIVEPLRPLALIKTCGKPDEDKLEEVSEHYERSIYYEKSDVVLMFRDIGGYVRVDAPDEYKDWVFTGARNTLYADLAPERVLTLLPCLTKK